MILFVFFTRGLGLALLHVVLSVVLSCWSRPCDVSSQFGENFDQLGLKSLKVIVVEVGQNHSMAGFPCHYFVDPRNVPKGQFLMPVCFWCMHEQQ